MGSRRPPSAPEWQVIIEEMRSQNRATLEAGEAFRESIEERIDRLDRESRDRDDLLARAIGDLRHEVRQHSTDIAELKALGYQNAGDVAGLKSDVVGLKSDVSELKSATHQNTTAIAELNALSQRQRAETEELRGETRALRLGLQENTLELRGLSQKVDALNQLHARVAALERKVSGHDSPA